MQAHGPRLPKTWGFAMMYNVVTIPLALFGVLTPALAALLMSSSSLIVMLNALRLRMPK